MRRRSMRAQTAIAPRMARAKITSPMMLVAAVELPVLICRIPEISFLAAALNVMRRRNVSARKSATDQPARKPWLPKKVHFKKWPSAGSRGGGFGGVQGKTSDSGIVGGTGNS